MTLQLTPEEAQRLQKIKGRSGNWNQVTARTPPDKIHDIKRMLLEGDSKHRVRRTLHVCVRTIRKVENQLQEEGLL